MLCLVVFLIDCGKDVTGATGKDARGSLSFPPLPLHKAYSHGSILNPAYLPVSVSMGQQSGLARLLPHLIHAASALTSTAFKALSVLSSGGKSIHAILYYPAVI